VQCYNIGTTNIRGIFFALSSSVKLALSLLCVEPVSKDLIENNFLGRNNKYFERSMEEL
jgi:hypothetical protein